MFLASTIRCIRYICLLLRWSHWTAVSCIQICSRARCTGQTRGEPQNYTIIITALLAGLGLFTAVVMYVSASWVADLIGNQHVAPSIRALSLALLFVPLMTGLRGYFQGMREMPPTAMSQVIEQAVRVTVMIVVLLWLIQQRCFAGNGRRWCHVGFCRRRMCGTCGDAGICIPTSAE